MNGFIGLLLCLGGFVIAFLFSTPLGLFASFALLFVGAFLIGDALGFDHDGH